MISNATISGTKPLTMGEQIPFRRKTRFFLLTLLSFIVGTTTTLGIVLNYDLSDVQATYSISVLAGLAIALLTTLVYFTRRAHRRNLRREKQIDSLADAMQRVTQGLPHTRVQSFEDLSLARLAHNLNKILDELERLTENSYSQLQDTTGLEKISNQMSCMTEGDLTLRMENMEHPYLEIAQSMNHFADKVGNLIHRTNTVYQLATDIKEEIIERAGTYIDLNLEQEKNLQIAFATIRRAINEIDALTSHETSSVSDRNQTGEGTYPTLREIYSLIQENMIALASVTHSFQKIQRALEKQQKLLGTATELSPPLLTEAATLQDHPQQVGQIEKLHQLTTKGAESAKEMELLVQECTTNLAKLRTQEIQCTREIANKLIGASISSPEIQSKVTTPAPPPLSTLPRNPYLSQKENFEALLVILEDLSKSCKLSAICSTAISGSIETLNDPIALLDNTTAEFLVNPE